MKFEYQKFNDAHNVYSIVALVYDYDNVELDYDTNVITVVFYDATDEQMRKIDRLLSLLRNLDIQEVPMDDELRWTTDNEGVREVTDELSNVETTHYAYKEEV